MQSSRDRLEVVTNNATGALNTITSDSLDTPRTLFSGLQNVNGGVASAFPEKTAGDGVASNKIKPTITKDRVDVLRWNGWGYNDSRFQEKNGGVMFTGSRYPIGEIELPFLLEWATEILKIDIKQSVAPQPIPRPEDYPRPNIDNEVLQKIREIGVEYSILGIDRLVRAHGQTLTDICMLRNGPIPRIPDVVVWPDCHNKVERLVALACEYNVVIIPYGGGTSVSGAATTPQHETRTIIVLDTTQMNRLLWVDKQNLTICCEAGIVGQDLERALQAQDLTTGHEPDSYEFSSVGGWVATRASGMKKNTYGNIEDLLVQAKMACPQGVLQKGVSHVPRTSIGPDFNHVILGSEGTLGVITEVVLKVRPLPSCRKYGSIIFPDFETGVNYMREVAKQRCQPSSIRFMDNEQFKFGLALRPLPGTFTSVLDNLKKAYLTYYKGYSWDTLCVATLLFEGTKESVAAQEKQIYSLAADFKGIPAGEKNGERGYMLTFVIAYLRDFALEYHIVAESFETSVPWDKTLMLCRNVKHTIHQECKAFNIQHRLVSCRVTQTYDIGCCVYFYFAFNWLGKSDPVHIFERIEESARDMIIACGGSLSHHHGVGKIRARWYQGQVSPLGVDLFRATKQQLDPTNIFANGNLVQAAKL